MIVGIDITNRKLIIYWWLSWDDDVKKNSVTSG